MLTHVDHSQPVIKRQFEPHLKELIHCGVQLFEDMQRGCAFGKGAQLTLLPFQFVPMQALPDCSPIRARK